MITIRSLNQTETKIEQTIYEKTKYINFSVLFSVKGALIIVIIARPLAIAWACISHARLGEKGS